jgi:hypothetical protein
MVLCDGFSMNYFSVSIVIYTVVRLYYSCVDYSLVNFMALHLVFF